MSRHLLQSSVPTPVNPSKLEIILRHYFNKTFLIDGFCNGFSIQFEGPNLNYELPNHKSASDKQEFLLQKIAEEISLGRCAGPFEKPPFTNFRISPLGLVPKREHGAYRIIHDLSLPAGISVNSGISDEYSTVQYETFDHVIALVIKSGQGALLAKCDILDAFRIVPVRPEDYHLLGFKIGNQYYYSKTLPMGCRVSCNLFEQLSNSLQWAMQNVYKFSDISHILDDFIFVGPPNNYECMRGVRAFIAMTNFVGIPLKQSKTVLPTTCTIIHGIEVDTITMTAKIPADKITRAINLISLLCQRDIVKLRDVQKIVGLLNFMCKCIKPGRAFLRRLWDLTSGINNFDKNQFVKLTLAAKQDLESWLLFLQSFNGVTLICSPSDIEHTLHIFTDASKTFGFGCVFQNKWFSGLWEDQIKQFNILILEFIPIVIAVHLFSDNLKNHSVLLHTDNEALMYILNNQTSKCKITMCLVRKLVVKALINNITFKAVHVRSQDNTICDLLSRFKVPTAKRLAPYLDSTPQMVPPGLHPCFLLQEHL